MQSSPLKDINKLFSIAKIGGWIGLVVGASLISFLEFTYFAIQLIRTGLKKGTVAPKKGRTKETTAHYNPPF